MNQTTTLETCPDLNHYEMVARILASELANLPLASDPLDVAETIEIISDEMGTMPDIINDCRLAVEAFDELDRVLDRMYALADRAVECGSDEVLLAGLDEEFRGYSHIVARLAGADDFDGPSLSLLTYNEAIVARQILGCLSAARHQFSQRLSDQRRRINSAMDEAIELLGHILVDVEDISHDTKVGLSELVSRLNELGRQFNDSPVQPYKVKWLN